MKCSIIFILLLTFLILSCENDSNKTKKEPVKFKPMGSQGLVHFVYIKPSLSNTTKGYKAVAKRVCKDEPVCIVMMWTHKVYFPVSLPLTEKQLSGKFAHYNRNRNTGLDRLLICSQDGC